MNESVLRRCIPSALVLLLAVAGAIAPAAPATGVDPLPVIPSEQYVVGGCRIVFDDGGHPHASGSTHKPCVGVESVARDWKGDLDVFLTDEASQPAIRLYVSPDARMVRRGVVAGATGGADKITVRLYDDKAGRRIDLNTSSERRGLRASAVSADPGALVQRGCSVDFSRSSASPRLTSNVVRLCTGVTGMRFSGRGDLVLGGRTTAIVSASSIGSRALSDYGIRVGLSGGGATSTYRFYSWKLDRTLTLAKRSDRVLFQRSGSSILLGWTHPSTL